MLQQAEDEDGSAAGRGRGVKIDQPSVADYGMKQLFIPEPNGHSICFESPTEQKAG